MKTKAEVIAALKKGLEEGTIKISDPPELRAWPHLCRHCFKLGVQKAKGMALARCPHCGGLN
jgi:hypothetical protein